MHIAIEDVHNGQRIIATCHMNLAQFNELTVDDADAGVNLLHNVRSLEADLDRVIALAKLKSEL
jgi:hypothetical protein